MHINAFYGYKPGDACCRRFRSKVKKEREKNCCYQHQVQASALHLEAKGLFIRFIWGASFRLLTQKLASCLLIFGCCFFAIRPCPSQAYSSNDLRRVKMTCIPKTLKPIHLNPRVLGWVSVEFSLNLTPTHLNIWIEMNTWTSKQALMR